MMNRQQQLALLECHDKVITQLTSDYRLLGAALHAVRLDTPKLHVVDDHAERVMQSMEKMIRLLQECV